ncbi:hypothetical protein [Pseudomonas mangiferae]|uniref:Uncharacterized protein n=1 Tax=Pseudomonas mangiferae TaxID=2593654 RepID=A0A553H0H7_9PSED|nr:hypothetical protein [Pseudomonas mangiferae]TRX75247.1 hypothetical protein FM069_09125 [Pseudomonas mangiferae]
MKGVSFFALALGLSAGCAANAVELAVNGQGQVLIYPLYSVESGNDTAIHLTNTASRPVTAKVRILEGLNGQVVHSFNLYLNEYDTWTGVLVRSETGARLVSADASCTVPSLPAEGVELGAGDPELAARSRVGTLEVIETGVYMAPASQSEEFALMQLFYGYPADCGRFSAAFAEGGVWAQNSKAGLAPPEGQLFGSVTMTNVMNGEQIALDATALLDFSQHARQTRPEDPEPTLAQSETVFAKMRGTSVSFRNGAEAVTALLTRRSADGEFAYGAGLNAETEWAVTFPTKAYLNADPEASRYSPYYNPLVIDGRRCEGFYSPYRNRDGSSRFEWAWANLCAITNIVGFGDSDILGGRYVRTQLQAPDSDTGWVSFDLEDAGGTMGPPNQYRNLAAFPGPAPFNLRGVGMIGFSVIRIQNGDVGGLLSNYVSVKRLTSLADPE